MEGCTELYRLGNTGLGHTNHFVTFLVAVMKFQQNGLKWPDTSLFSL